MFCWFHMYAVYDLYSCYLKPVLHCKEKCSPTESLKSCVVVLITRYSFRYCNASLMQPFTLSFCTTLSNPPHFIITNIFLSVLIIALHLLDIIAKSQKKKPSSISKAATHSFSQAKSVLHCPVPLDSLSDRLICSTMLNTYN